MRRGRGVGAGGTEDYIHPSGDREQQFSASLSQQTPSVERLQKQPWEVLQRRWSRGPQRHGSARAMPTSKAIGHHTGPQSHLLLWEGLCSDNGCPLPPSEAILPRCLHEVQAESVGASTQLVPASGPFVPTWNVHPTFPAHPLSSQDLAQISSPS